MTTSTSTISTSPVFYVARRVSGGWVNCGRGSSLSDVVSAVADIHNYQAMQREILSSVSAESVCEPMAREISKMKSHLLAERYLPRYVVTLS